jgi:glucokinase
MTALCLALEVGGTQLRAALADAEGNLQSECGASTPQGARSSTIVAAMLELASNCIAKSFAPVVGIGISATGVIDPLRGVVAEAGDTVPGWAGTELAKPFVDRFALPVHCDNDANCALRAEAWLGRHPPSDSGCVVMLTLGTGLGGAILFDGKILDGARHRAGHFGHAICHEPLLSRPARIEEIVSGTGLRNIWRAMSPDATAPTGQQIMMSFAGGDERARRVVGHWCEAMANVIESIQWSLDPAWIVLGGGVIESRKTWWQELVGAMDRRALDVPVRPAALGNRAGLVGAAKLAWDARR